jgi:hypothetical protein
MFQYLHPAWEDIVGRDRGLFLRQTFDAAQYHFVVQFIAVQGLTGFADARLALVGVAGAVVVEVLLAFLRPRLSPGWRMSVFCALAPAAFWGVYFGGVAVGDHGLGWPPELWGGATVWSGLTLLALALMTAPPRARPKPER